VTLIFLSFALFLTLFRHAGLGHDENRVHEAFFDRIPAVFIPPACTGRSSKIHFPADTPEPQSIQTLPTSKSCRVGVFCFVFIVKKATNGLLGYAQFGNLSEASAGNAFDNPDAKPAAPPQLGNITLLCMSCDKLMGLLLQNRHPWNQSRHGEPLRILILSTHSNLLDASVPSLVVLAAIYLGIQQMMVFWLMHHRRLRSE
jgi:hypothetical protein